MIPANYGRDTLSEYLRKNLENYIDQQEFEKWFDIKKTLIPLSKVDEIFDLNDNDEICTIGLIANPYTRVWLNYVMNIPLTEVSIQGFSDFICNGIYQHPDFTKKMVEVYNHNDKSVDIILDYENISIDLKQIKELSNNTDTNLFDDFYAIVELSKDYYTDELRQKVYTLFKEDFDFYEY